MLRSTTLLVGLVLSSALVAQLAVEDPADARARSGGAAAKRVQQAIKEGDALAAKGGVDEQAALQLYREALLLDPDNAELQLRIGRAHLNGSDRFAALAYLQKAYELDSTLHRINYMLGYAYHLHGLWDQAIHYYSAHRALEAERPDPDPSYDRARRLIEECRNGSKHEAAATRARVRNLGPAVNGPSADLGAMLSPDGQRLYFTSRRGAAIDRHNKQTNEPHESIFAAERTAYGWTSPVPMQAPINSAYNDACVAFADEGRSMLIFRDAKGHGDLYTSRYSAGAWQEPVSLGEHVNSTSNESSAWVTADGKWLFFSSDRPGGRGGMDIWRSPWIASTSTWGEPINLGPQVNTEYDEEGVFVSADGRTLYFSSKGHDSMGGYDVFRTSSGATGWSKAENMGWPVNSTDDDLYFMLMPDGRNGFMSSIRPDGHGWDDLYAVDLAPDDLDLVASAAGGGVSMPSADEAVEEKQELQRLRVFIRSLKPIAAIDARITLVDVDDPSSVTVVVVPGGDKDRSFEVQVPAGRHYAVSLYADGHMPGSATHHGDGDGDLELALVPADSGAHAVLHNVQWANEQAELDPRSAAELDQVAAWLLERSDLQVEVGGHTDVTGSAQHNAKLSQQRADAVRRYLGVRGVALERIVAAGYGSERPVVVGDDPLARARNRRTEITVR